MSKLITQNIVLVKFFPNKKLVCIFNEQRGKINATCSDKVLDTFWLGTVFDSVVIEKQFNTFSLEQVNRNSQLSRINLEQYAWLQAFAQFCFKILPWEQACTNIFLMLKNIFEFNWKKLTIEQSFLVQKICIIELLKVLGYIFDEKIEFFSNFFNILLNFKIDVDGILGLQSRIDDLKLFGESYKSLISQVKNNLPTAFIDDFFCLLNTPQNKYNFINDAI